MNLFKTSFVFVFLLSCTALQARQAFVVQVGDRRSLVERFNGKACQAFWLALDVLKQGHVLHYNFNTSLTFQLSKNDDFYRAWNNNCAFIFAYLEKFREFLNDSSGSNAFFTLWNSWEKRSFKIEGECRRDGYFGLKKEAWSDFLNDNKAFFLQYPWLRTIIFVCGNGTPVLYQSAQTVKDELIYANKLLELLNTRPDFESLEKKVEALFENYSRTYSKEQNISVSASGDILLNYDYKIKNPGILKLNRYGVRDAIFETLAKHNYDLGHSEVINFRKKNLGHLDNFVILAQLKNDVFNAVKEHLANTRSEEYERILNVAFNRSCEFLANKDLTKSLNNPTHTLWGQDWFDPKNMGFGHRVFRQNGSWFWKNSLNKIWFKSEDKGISVLDKKAWSILAMIYQHVLNFDKKSWFYNQILSKTWTAIFNIVSPNYKIRHSKLTSVAKIYRKYLDDAGRIMLREVRTGIDLDLSDFFLVDPRSRTIAFTSFFGGAAVNPKILKKEIEVALANCNDAELQAKLQRALVDLGPSLAERFNSFGTKIRASAKKVGSMIGTTKQALAGWNPRASRMIRPGSDDVTSSRPEKKTGVGGVNGFEKPVERAAEKFDNLVFRAVKDRSPDAYPRMKNSERVLGRFANKLDDMFFRRSLVNQAR